MANINEFINTAKELADLAGKKAGEGVEFHLLYAGSAFALFLTGPGPWSVDAWCMNIVHVIFG